MFVSLMNRALVLLVAVNVLVVAFGGLFAYSDLYMRTYETRSHTNTRVVSVEYGLLVYRPTYEYYDIKPEVTRISRGSWAFDFFQLAIFVMVIADIGWYLAKRQTKQVALTDENAEGI
jgi:hypothetical protein